MLNEGIITNSTKSLVKSEMLRQLTEETTPEQWERRVFEAVTKHKREDVDWEFEDNQAGYYTWIKSFDGLIDELIEDGYVMSVANQDGSRMIKAPPVTPPSTTATWSTRRASRLVGY